MAEWSQVRGQTKNGSQDPMEDLKRGVETLPGAPVWSQAQTEGSLASA